MHKMTKKQKRKVLKIEEEGKNAEDGRHRSGNEAAGQEKEMDERGHGADTSGASHVSVVRGICISAHVRYDYCL